MSMLLGWVPFLPFFALVLHTCIFMYEDHECNLVPVCVRFGADLYRCDTLGVCKSCDISISEMVEFLNSDRVHMQQGIFPDVQQSYILHSQLGFDEVCCKVLIGAPLKQNEFLKIDQTCFADIISEEGGNEHLRQESPPGMKEEEGEGERDKEAAFEGEELIVQGSSIEKGEAVSTVHVQCSTVL